MIIDMSYWTKIFKKILYLFLIILAVFLIFKLLVFYMPFLIAFLISLLIEPLIRLIMRKTKFTRKTSSIIAFILVSAILIGIIIWIAVSLFSEASNLLSGLNGYMDKANSIFSNITNNIDFQKLELPNEIKNVIQDSSNEAVSKTTSWIRNLLSALINFISSIPTVSIYVTITIIALYLICVDRVYILDQIEHHFPTKWIKKFGTHKKDLSKTFGEYLKAEATLIFISFIISLIGLYIFKFLHLNVKYPLLMALFIGFVDALPILGSGTVMIPWAIITALDGDLRLAVSIFILFVIMSVVRQFLEPRLVSKHIGTHPIFTLIAMYTGFKIFGVFGLIIGPIVLIIVKNVFQNSIDEGLFKAISE